MCESNTARSLIVKDLPLKLDEMLIKCRIRSEINRAELQGEMNKNGPFLIDRKVVPVKFYQKALLTNGMDPMRILSEIARLSGWGDPVYSAIYYRVSEGFLCSVSVRGKFLVANWSSWRPNLAQIMAAATFLSFLGFVVNVDFYKHVLPGWSHIGDHEKFFEDIFEKKYDSPHVKLISESVLMKAKQQTIENEDKLKRASKRSLARMEYLFQWLTKSSGTLNPSIDSDDEMRLKCLNPGEVHRAMDSNSKTSSTFTSETSVSKPTEILMAMQTINDKVELSHDKNLDKDSRLKVIQSPTMTDELETPKEEDLLSIDSTVERQRRKRSSGSPVPTFYKKVKFGRLHLCRCNTVDDTDKSEKRYKNSSEKKQVAREDQYLMKKRKHSTTVEVIDLRECGSDDQSKYRLRKNSLGSSTHTTTNCCLNKVDDTIKRILEPPRDPLVKSVKCFIKAYENKAKDYLDNSWKFFHKLKIEQLQQ